MCTYNIDCVTILHTSQTISWNHVCVKISQISIKRKEHINVAYNFLILIYFDIFFLHVQIKSKKNICNHEPLSHHTTNSILYTLYTIIHLQSFTNCDPIPVYMFQYIHLWASCNNHVPHTVIRDWSQKARVTHSSIISYVFRPESSTFRPMKLISNTGRPHRNLYHIYAPRRTP